MVSAIDLVKDLEQRPVARQLRHSLLQYMASEQFAADDSGATCSAARVVPLPLVVAAAGGDGASQQPAGGLRGGPRMDGNPDTIWHTACGPGSPSHPHEFMMDLQGVHEIRGLTYLPRQDMTNGRIAKYEIYACEDGRTWGTPLAAGEWPDSKRSADRVRSRRPSGPGTSSWSPCRKCAAIRSPPLPRSTCYGSRVDARRPAIMRLAILLIWPLPQGEMHVKILYSCIAICLLALMTDHDLCRQSVLVEWTTPFEVPPFDQIKLEHYRPAFDEAMKRTSRKWRRSACSSSAPTFENTIEALDRSGAMLDRVSNVFFAMKSSMNNDEMEVDRQGHRSAAVPAPGRDPPERPAVPTSEGGLRGARR